MNRKEYYDTPESKLKGQKVRTLAQLENGWGVIPRGTIATITRKRGGFGLRTEPCPTCGLRASISRVHCQDVELLPEGGLT